MTPPIKQFLEEDLCEYAQQVTFHITEEIENPLVRCSPDGYKFIQKEFDRGIILLKMVEIMYEGLSKFKISNSDCYHEAEAIIAKCEELLNE